MKKQAFALILVLVLSLAVSTALAQSGDGPETELAIPAGAQFTYQGLLKDETGAPVQGTCDFQFRLFDSDSAVTPIGAASLASGVTVDQGYFTAAVNTASEFGSTAFTGAARYLEVSVRCPSGSGVYTPLAPRQRLNAAPLAGYAAGAPWSGLTGIPAGFADGVDNNSTYTNGTGLSLVGTTFNVTGAPWSGLTGVPAGFADGVDNTYSGWGLTGNSGTDPASQFLGTTDNVALVLRAGNAPALRLEPNVESPNVIGGHSINSVGAGFHGATIGGGGGVGWPNMVLGNFATISGGMNNRAGGLYSSITGGLSNQIDGQNSSILGGSSNQINGQYSSIAGGLTNLIEGDNSSIAGGYTNQANGDYSTVAGGIGNYANGDYSFAAGSYARAVTQGSFVWSDTSDTTPFSSFFNNQFLIRAAGGVGINTNETWFNALTVNGQVIAGGTATGFSGGEPFIARGGSSGISMDDRDGASDRWVIFPSAGRLIFWSGTNKMSLSSTGVLDLGALGVAGSTSLCRNGNGEIASCSSSIRYKTNVAPLSFGMDLINQLHPVTFDWKDSGQPDLGFVAEDVAKVAPLLITHNDAGEIEGVKYDRINAVLVNAVQEQQQQIDSLEERIASLEQSSPASSPGPWLALSLGSALVLLGAVIVQSIILWRLVMARQERRGTL